MPSYECDIYYSGYVTVPVEADNEEQALDKARGEVASHSRVQQAEFTEEIVGNLEEWREADTVRKN